jgi:hypothetical protein
MPATVAFESKSGEALAVYQNNLSGTERCIQSAMRQDIGSINVMAIDNGSVDGCGPWLRSLPRVTTISHPRRRNLHKIWNEGLILAFRKLRLDHLLIINNDIILRPDMYRLLAEDGGGFVTGVAVDSMEQLTTDDPGNRRPHLRVTQARWWQGASLW